MSQVRWRLAKVPIREGISARSVGFEPTTPGFEGRYSIQLSYERLCPARYSIMASLRSRLRRPILYPGSCTSLDHYGRFGEGSGLGFSCEVTFYFLRKRKRRRARHADSVAAAQPGATSLGPDPTQSSPS